MDSTQNDGSDNLKRFRRFTAFLAVFLILLGQYLIFSSPVSDVGTVIPPYLWLGVLGVIVFMAGQVVRPPAFLLKFFGRFSNAGAPGWIGAAVIFSLLAAFASAAFEKFTRVNYIPVLTLWFISIACYVAAFTQGAVSKGSWKDWFRQYRWEVLAVAVIMALAAVVRFYKLGVIPRVMDGDEGRLGLIAQSTLTGPLANPFALWENFGAIYLQGMNFFIRLYGPTMFALRFLPAVGGVLAIPAVYLLGRQMAGQRVALISAVLVAISHTHIHFSRIASVAYIQDTWLVPLELYFLLSGLEKRSAWRAAVGGAILAIHFGIYLSAQIVIAMLLVYMLVAFVFLRSWFKPLLRVGLAFWGGFLIVALPEAVYIWNHPNDFLNRLGADGTFQSGWLTKTMEVTGQSALEIFFGRAVHVFLSLIYYPAVDFYGSPVPPLSLI
ncbi:MAG: glycosyltransferase family 39 protein, partial [Chloroflexota bacterium]